MYYTEVYKKVRGLVPWVEKVFDVLKGRFNFLRR